MERPIDRLARRSENDPFFLGWALAIYASSRRLDDEALGKALGCAVETLTSLRLCRLPAEDGPGFGRDVERIANRFGVDMVALAEIVREARATEAMRSAPEGAQGTLLAAREDEEPDEAEEGEEP